MPSSTAALYRWNDVPNEVLNESVERRFITADRLRLAQFELKRGGIVPRHSHENQQVAWVINGAMKCSFEDHELIARPGEIVVIPAWLEHQAEALEDTLEIDLFSPVRQDWLDKTDTYFKK